MSWTLFKYIFKDLVRIFLLTSGALAGIMSFGGLLRPLYEYGLSAGQAMKILSYFSPAMTTYSLPIAALFATTIVYGRLSADNEVTAARAAGISHGMLALPALVLGLLGALVSILLLCFVVPAFTLKVERVIYSNVAGLVADQIERTHQIRFDHANATVTVFAQAAEALPVDPKSPREQSVRLIAPMIVTYESSGGDKSKPPVPEFFYMAREARAQIRQHEEEDSDVTLFAWLEGGTRFPRRFIGPQRQNMQVNVRATTFGPIPVPSPVRENTKFMDYFRLTRLLHAPENSRRVRSTLRDFIIQDQKLAYLSRLREQLNGASGSATFLAGGERYVLTRGGGAAELRKGRLLLPANGTPVRFAQMRGDRAVLSVAAQEIYVNAIPDSDEHRIDVEVEMTDCVVGAGEEQAPHENFTRPFVVAMPIDIQVLENRTAGDYVGGKFARADEPMRLSREVLRLTNSIISELNARASFGVSCLILVMVGCALGMMFRSGNFLSAFAISVIPALLTIALIVAGQHTCENIPWSIAPGWNNPLHLGLALIWAGNAVVAVIAVVLLWRLQRQ